MTPGLRFAIVAILLAAVGGTIALTSRHSSAPDFAGTPSATPTPATCLTPPPKIPTPSWYPSDLPLPTGSYAVQYQLTPLKGYRQGVFIVAGSLQSFVQHALKVWPQQGWVLGRGDSEPGEAEDTFTKQREARFGAFRANTVLCNPNQTFVYLVFGTIQTPNLVRPTGSASPKPLKT